MLHVKQDEQLLLRGVQEKGCTALPERGRGYRKLAKELGLKDKKTLRGWVAKVQRGESLEDGRGKATNVYKGEVTY